MEILFKVLYLLRNSQTLCRLGDLLFFFTVNLSPVDSSLGTDFEEVRKRGFLAATLPLLCENTSLPPAISIILFIRKKKTYTYIYINKI